MPTAHKPRLGYAERQELFVNPISNEGIDFVREGGFRGLLAGLTRRWQLLQNRSPQTATAATALEMRPKEVLCLLGRQVLGRVLHSFSGEVIQVRLDESDDAALIRAAEFPQDPAHPRLCEPLPAS